MENKLRKHINKKFKIYPKTKEIVEVREELFSIMLDKYNDCLQSGETAEESYRSAVEMMADYKAAIREVETGSSMSALKKSLVSLAAISSFYFISLTLIYLFVSMFLVDSFEKTWLIAVGGAFVYIVFLSFNGYRYARLFNLRVLTRCAVALIFISMIPVLYVFPSMVLSVTGNGHIWGRSWMMVIVISLGYLLADYLVFRRQLSIFERGMHLVAAGLVFTTLLYFLASMWLGLWSSAWILYVLYLAIVSLAFYIGEKTGKFLNEKTGDE